MPFNSNPFKASEPCKCTLSTKAATNGDPQEEQKQQKLDNSQKKLMAPTKKQTTTTSNKVSSSKAAPAKVTIAVKATATAKKWQVAPAKPTPWHPSVEIEDIDDNSDHPKSNPPCNPRHILEATDGSDDEVAVDENPPELIGLDDNDNDDPMDVEAPEESAKAQLST